MPQKIELTLDLVNAILQALGKCQYEAVFQVVNEIHVQAVPQLPPAPPAEEAPAKEAE